MSQGELLFLVADAGLRALAVAGAVGTVACPRPSAVGLAIRSAGVGAAGSAAWYFSPSNTWGAGLAWGTGVVLVAVVLWFRLPAGRAVLAAGVSALLYFVAYLVAHPILLAVLPHE